MRGLTDSERGLLAEVVRRRGWGCEARRNAGIIGPPSGWFSLPEWEALRTTGRVMGQICSSPICDGNVHISPTAAGLEALRLDSLIRTMGLHVT